MLKYRIFIILLLLLLYLVGVSPSAVGVSATSPWWTHLVYMFFHANLPHLVANALSIWCLLSCRIIRQPGLLLLLLYLSAVLASYPFPSTLPTVGFSGAVFAMAGITLCHCRSARAWITVGICLALGLLSRSVHVLLHASALLCGVLTGRIYIFLFRLSYDCRRATYRR